MFPSPFDYVSAGSVEEAIAAKAEGGEDTRFLVGGQSLLPMMKMRPRVARGARRNQPCARTRRARARQRPSPVGAIVRHADIVRSDLPFGVVASAAPGISDPLVRNLGTMCGSVADCDPEGDWNSVLLATGADVVARGPGGERTIPISEFTWGVFTNVLGRGRDGHRSAHPRSVRTGRRLVPEARTQDRRLRHGRGRRTCRARRRRHDREARGRAHCGRTREHEGRPRPKRSSSVSRPSDELFAEAGELAAQASDPASDVRGSAEWKRNVVRVFMCRVLGRGE